MNGTGPDDVFVARLVERLAGELADVREGHCLRVEPLQRAVAARAARTLRERVEPGGAEVWVLGQGQPQDADLELTTDRAIEIRNRKRHSLCLFVPAELQDAALSSLGNSFAVFDVTRYLQELAEDLRREIDACEDIPDELKRFVRAVRTQLRRGATPPAEQEVGYCAGIMAQPTPLHAGEDLWKLGLIPDLEGANAPDFAARLERNRECVDRLIRPRRAQASPDERIASLGLQPGPVLQDLRQFLLGRRLQTDSGWLKDILETRRGALTFEQWHFPEAEPTELLAVAAEPFLDDQQRAKPFSKLKQEAPGTQLYAECGPKKTVVVKWHTTPSKPEGVGRWRVEMVPCRDEYDLDALGAVDLPVVTVGRNSRSAKIPLEMEIEGLEVRRVNVVITPLDNGGFEIRSPDAEQPFSACTLDFWLEAGGLEEEAETRRRVATVRCFPDAYLHAALETRATERIAQHLAREEKDLLYFPVLVNERQLHRVGVSPFMYDLQSKVLAEPDTGGRYRAGVDGVDPLGIANVEPIPIQPPDGLAGPWEDFLKVRRLFFRTVRNHEPRGIIEAADLDGDMIRRGRAYARAYLDLLRTFADHHETQGPSIDVRGVAEDIGQLDTLQIEYKGTTSPVNATVILPTHPLRTYWYLCYAELLAHYEAQLYGREPKTRKRSLSYANIERLVPQNFPAFVAARGGQLHVYAANINFFTGVALHPEAADPAAHVQEVSRLLGYDAEAIGSDVDAQRIAREIGSYLDIHSYADALRLNVINPGGGGIVRDVVLALLRQATSDDTRATLRSVDIITHTDPTTIQRPAPGLDELVSAGYRDAIPRGWSHLHPMLQVARRPIDTLDSLPGHDTHVALCLDHFRPRLVPGDPGQHEDSASAYGLVARFQSNFEPYEQGATWSRAVVYVQPPQIERHPVNPGYTTELIALHHACIRHGAFLAEGQIPAGSLPHLLLEVGPDSVSLLSLLHDRADWVVTVDRHFGVEYYDDPSNPDTARHSERYLLDYAPEFMEGMGHRMIVTTGWRDEVLDVLARGLDAMALSSDAGSCRVVLNALKAVSGRLALRLVRDAPQEKEAISLAILIEYLRSRGELEDAFLVPVDAHPELLDPSGTAGQSGAVSRCDLMLVKPGRGLRVSFVEAKYRSGELGPGAEGALLDRIADQTRRTEEAFCEAFGCLEDGKPPVDHAIRRAHLANVLRFYLERARRHGLMSAEAHVKLKAAVQRIEADMPRLDIRRIGYVVSPSAHSRSKITHQGTTVYFIGAPDIHEGAGLISTAIPPEEHVLTAMTPEPAAEAQEVRPGETPVDAQPPVGHVDLAGPEALRVTLGETLGAGQQCDWLPSTKGSPHVFIVGIPGQGKSVTTRRIVQACVQQGLATLALDFHGELASKATEILDGSRCRVMDAASGLPFSPFEAVGDKNQAAMYWQANAFSVAEIVGWVCDLGDIQRDLVYEAIRNCYRASFVDAEEPCLPTPDDVFAEAQRLEESRKVRNVVARVRPLFDVDFELFRPTPGLSLYDLVTGLAVIDLHNLGQETLQLAAGAFVLRKVYKDMLQWPPSEQLRLLLVLDEAHRLAKDLTLPKIMKEGRKFGVVVAGASQGLADFHPDVLGNAGTKVVFRMNFPESKRVAGLVRGDASEQDISRRIEGLSVGRAIVSTPEGRQPAECVMSPPDVALA